MIEDTITRIEARLRDASSLDDQRRTELLGLLTDLKREMDELPDSQAEHAASITGFVDVSTHEATRAVRDPKLTDLALEGLASSTREFETSHPKLAETVNGICKMLSDLGI